MFSAGNDIGYGGGEAFMTFLSFVVVNRSAIFFEDGLLAATIIEAVQVNVHPLCLQGG